MGDFLLMEKQWGIIELLNYSRHDWLNKIQLIKGNLELNNIDNVKEIIDSIVIEAKNETKLVYLQMPKLAEYMMTSNWREYVFSVEYEVISIIPNVCNLDETVAQWTSTFMETLNVSLDPLGENELKIIIDGTENSLRFTFDLVGKITNKRAIQVFLEECPSLASKSIQSFNDEELVFDLEFPIQA